jgi:hypothetical protein
MPHTSITAFSVCLATILILSAQEVFHYLTKILVRRSSDKMENVDLSRYKTAREALAVNDPELYHQLYQKWRDYDATQKRQSPRD